MTIREMYLNAIDALNGKEIEVPVEEIASMLQDRLEKHDTQNEKRKNAERKPSPKQIAQAEYDAKLMESISEILTEDLNDGQVYCGIKAVNPFK